VEAIIKTLEYQMSRHLGFKAAKELRIEADIS
jgi:hypothetical protein